MIAPQPNIDGSDADLGRVRSALSVSGETLTVTLSGELDRLNAADIMDAVDGAVATGTSCLVIDLARLTFIDSSGIHALVNLHKTFGAEGVDVRLALPDDAPVRRTLEIANITDLIASERR